MTGPISGDPLATSLADVVMAGVQSGGNVKVPATLLRERLSAARTYYVRTDGSDSNNGLANTAGGAFLTIQKAIDVICGEIDLGGQTVTLNIADGTYTAGFNISKAWTGGGTIAVVGNAASPGNVIISTTAAHAIRWQGVLPAIWTLTGVELRTTTSGDCIRGDAPGQLNFGSVIFGACAGSHIHTLTQGARVQTTGNYTINGGAQRHWNIEYGAIRIDGRTITLGSTPAFSSQFAYAAYGGIMQVNGNTFSGSATGTRYLAELAGGINTGGGGASYLPGNAGGSVVSPGWYA